jgi:hypothetical protein
VYHDCVRIIFEKHAISGCLNASKIPYSFFAEKESKLSFYFSFNMDIKSIGRLLVTLGASIEKKEEISIILNWNEHETCLDYFKFI